MNIDQGNPVLAAALAYAARGWRIFPCDPHPVKPRSKRPLVVADKDSAGKSIEGTGWPAKASCDPDVIRGWWKRWPKALIGMAPGWAGAFVVDLDPKGESVEAVEARLAAAIGAALPDGPRSITQSGGLHLWFRRPDREAIGNETPGLANIDIRCDHGYVIMPPSVMGDGRFYAWESNPFEGFAPDVPPALMDLIDNRKSRTKTSGEMAAPSITVQLRAASDAAREARERYGRGSLAKIKADAAVSGKGHRGRAIFAAACAAGRLVAAGAVSEREALAAVMDAADACGLTKDDGPRSVEREIRRGMSEGAADAEGVIRRIAEVEAEAETKARRFTSSRRGALDDAPPAEEWPDHVAEVGGHDDDMGDAAAWIGDNGGAALDSSEAGASVSEVAAACAIYDHSDTDNGRRLIAHFGDHLRVMQRKGVRNVEYLVWAGNHWDLDTGSDSAFAIAQEIGDRIGLEADHLAFTQQEAKAIEAAAAAKEEYPDVERVIEDLEATIRAIGKLDTAERRTVEARTKRADAEAALDTAKRRLARLDETIGFGLEAKAELKKRQVARRRFGVSSKNKSRLDAMLACAAPHLTTAPAEFNADPRRVATETHTLVFERAKVREIDLENPDPDGVRYVERVRARCVAHAGHDPADLITFRVPQPYVSDAAAPEWRAFLDKYLPIEAVRRCFQVFAGLGLLGETVQKLCFNYGDGANGKSVAMQTIFNVLGDLAVNLEPESIVGTDTKSGASASPDMIKLFGKRFLRISELPHGEPVKEALVKKITGGGEEISARGLFQGFVDFIPVFTAMMSGNDYPRIDGTNDGIWRRIAVILWPIKVPEAERLPMNEMIDRFRPEYSGILNWLIEGAIIYLEEGLVIPDEVRASTKEMKDEMDPLNAFIEACVEKAPGMSEAARSMYEAYVSWALANGVKPIFETRFGKAMKGRFVRDDGRIRRYLDCRLHDVPERPEPKASPSASRSVPSPFDDPSWTPDD